MNEAKQEAISSLFKAGKYSVTRDGRVFSRAGYRSLTTSRREIKAYVHKKGYAQVMLTGQQSKEFCCRVHQLVWLFFHGRYSPTKQINHIDGVKLNNRISNLELVTASENMQHAYRFGLLPHQTGENHGSSKLTEAAVLDIRKRSLAGEKLRELADRFGVTQSNVSYILKRHTWKNV